MKYYLQLTILAFLSSYFTIAQDADYAHKIVEDLCAPAFHGRGYYKNGEKLAAEYIRKEFKSIGLKSFKNDYFQNFSLSVNAINGDLQFSIDGQELKPGEDFLIDPSSPDYNSNSELIFLKKNQLVNLNKFKAVLPKIVGKFVVIDQSLVKSESREVKNQVYDIIQFLKFEKKVSLNGVIELTDKLIYTASQKKAARPHIVLKASFLSKKNKSIHLNVDSQFFSKYRTQNVIGYIEGENKDSAICIVGHYDHLGRMGHDVYFPGANDNASGIAMMLGLAKSLAKEKKPKFSIVFIAFGAEEIGLVGSRYYTENPVFPLENIHFLINLDILGTGDDGIQVVNGSKFKREFDQLVEMNKTEKLLKQVKIRGEACNSDHCFFNEKGVRSFYIYTLGGIAHYHNIYDKSETLPLTEYNDLMALLKKFILNQ